jgi:hypothetical protein
MLTWWPLLTTSLEALSLVRLLHELEESGAGWPSQAHTHRRQALNQAHIQVNQL